MNTENGHQSSQTSSSQEHPVRHFQSQASGEGCQTQGADSCSDFLRSFPGNGQDMSSGRMFQVFFPLTEDGILEPSSGRWLNSGMVSPTECLTLQASEFPSDAEESLLSDALETGSHLAKYFLSQKACQGMLDWAAKRNIQIQEPLLTALRQQTSGGCHPTESK